MKIGGGGGHGNGGFKSGFGCSFDKHRRDQQANKIKHLPSAGFGRAVPRRVDRRLSAARYGDGAWRIGRSSDPIVMIGAITVIIIRHLRIIKEIHGRIVRCVSEGRKLAVVCGLSPAYKHIAVRQRLHTPL